MTYKLCVLFSFISVILIYIPIIIICNTRLTRICKYICNNPHVYGKGKDLLGNKIFEEFTFKGKQFKIHTEIKNTDFSDHYDQFLVFINDKHCLTIDAVKEFYTYNYKFIYRTHDVNIDQLIKVLKACKKHYFKVLGESCLEKEKTKEDLY